VRQGADWDRSGTGLEKGSKVQGFQGSKVQRFKGSKVQGFKGSKVQGFKGSRVQRFKGSKVQGLSGQLSVFFFPRANASKFYRKSRQRAVSLGCLAREYTDGIPVKPLNDSI
jgi:hypothetical protein